MSEEVRQICSRLCAKYDNAEVVRILQELEEKADEYEDKTESLHVAHRREFAGG
jgi:hypothetical protein